MESFEYGRTASAKDAIAAHAKSTTAQQGASVRFLAGGTTLIDLMKLEVERPTIIVDINQLKLSQVENTKDGGLKIGALVRNAELAHHSTVEKKYAVLSQAILAGASPQLRNKATTSGNILQRTRCVYFRDISKPCNKRHPGSGCAAIGGHNRNLAILGTSSDCIATNPSDMNVAMMALNAAISIENSNATREVAFADFYLLPGKTPDKENVLTPGDLITSVTIPPLKSGTKSLYLKLRDRASYEFALASAAIVMNVEQGKITNVQIAMGGVGTKPWRSPEAEAVLKGQSPNDSIFIKAAEAALKDAKPVSQNGFKVELAKRCLTHALKQTAMVRS